MVHGFHNGAPVYACEYMKPDVKHGGVTGDEGHTTQSQNWAPTYGNGKTPPYYIQIENGALSYTPGQAFKGQFPFKLSLISSIFNFKYII